MATVDVTITNTPTDIIAGQSLTAGRYTAQNVGSNHVRFAEADAALADPSTLRGGGHIILPTVAPTITVRSSNAIYFWTDDDDYTGLISVTEAE